MSMLSAQCDELREKAKLLRGHADGLKAPYVIPSTKELMALTMLDSAMRMEEAADTIISLRDRLQAAELGSGTCKNEWAQFGKFRCSECWLQVDSISTNTTAPIPIKHCPNCGAKVVER